MNAFFPSANQTRANLCILFFLCSLPAHQIACKASNDTSAFGVHSDTSEAKVCSITLRLLDPFGKPLCKRPTRFALSADGPNGWHRTVGHSNTDKDGQLVCHLDCPSRDDLSTSMLFTLYSPDKSGTGGMLFASTNILLLPSGNVLSLGNVTVQVAKPLVTGYALDPQGQSIEGASVLIEVKQPGYWFPVGSAELHSDGSFFIYDELGSRPMRLVAQKKGYARSDAVEFLPGDEGIELNLNWGAGVEGRIALPPGRNTEDYAISLRRASSESLEATTHIYCLRLEADGRFSGKDLRSGTYTLDVKDRKKDKCLVSVRAIELFPGQIADDSRLADIVVPIQK